MFDRFFSFTAGDLLRELRRLGVREGDTLIVHSAYSRFAGFQGGVAEAIAALQAAVGLEGHLLMPTMPFSGSALDYANSGETTDLARTPSRMGALTEVYRKRPDVIRSIHPTHPVAIGGPRAARFAEGHYLAESPCGKGTPFHRLLEAGGKTLLAGVSISCMTFFHHMEEVLEPDMPFSPFTPGWFELKTRDAAGRDYSTRTRLFDRSLSERRELARLIPPLERAGEWRTGRAGRLDLAVVSAAAALEAGRELARRGRYCYREH